MIVFVANSNSPHIRPWISHFPFDYNVVIYSPFSGVDKIVTKHLCTVPKILFVNKSYGFLPLPPKLIRYALLGLYLRINLPKNAVLHVHGASGNGIAALISGHKFVCTIYGSELFGFSKKNLFYKLMIESVLRQAFRLSASSIAALPCLEKISSSLPSKSRVFSLGISNVYFENQLQKNYDRNSRTWFINRRVHPHYRTDAVVKGFLRYRAESGSGRLIILAGDSDPHYLLQVKNLCSGVECIEILEDPVDEYGMRDLLDRSDFAISTPKTDQLSSAILEAIARNCVNILPPLIAYQNVPAIFLDEKRVNFEDSIFNAFVKTSAMRDIHLDEIATKAINYLSMVASPSAVARSYHDFIKGI